MGPSAILCVATSHQINGLQCPPASSDFGWAVLKFSPGGECDPPARSSAQGLAFPCVTTSQLASCLLPAQNCDDKESQQSCAADSN